jgi:hypothetical protein
MNEFRQIRSGIYFLCKDKKVVYIGQSRDVLARVNGHLGLKEFDSVMSMLVPEGLLDEAEQYWLKRIKPELNIRYVKNREKLPRTTKSYSITVPKDFLPVIKRMAFESGRSVSSYLSSLIRKDTKDL